MFNFFINFQRARTLKESLILYISHLIVGLAFVFAFVFFLHVIIPLNMNLQSYFGGLGAVLYVAWLSLRVMQSREWDLKNTTITIISVLLSAIGGLIFGLIPLVFLTTLKPKKESISNF